jgi:phosphonoacetaldehyde hydrolase
MSAPGLSAFDLVIFDWAGTMVDFGSRAPIQALVRAFEIQGVALSEATARKDMGRAKVDHVRALLAEPDVATAWAAAGHPEPDETHVAAIMADLTPLMREAAAAASELIPGAAETTAALRAAGLRVASCTGYTRDMMGPVLARAAEQGYSPDTVVCAGETPQGRPSPLMVYKICAELGVWPLSRVVKVDDAEAGIEEGRNAGCFTIGLAASGNGLGLSRAELEALSPAEREDRLAPVRASMYAAGADLVIDSVADLMKALAA